MRSPRQRVAAASGSMPTSSQPKEVGGAQRTNSKCRPSGCRKRQPPSRALSARRIAGGMLRVLRPTSSGSPCSFSISVSRLESQVKRRAVSAAIEGPSSISHRPAECCCSSVHRHEQRLGSGRRFSTRLASRRGNSPPAPRARRLAARHGRQTSPDEQATVIPETVAHAAVRVLPPPRDSSSASRARR